MKQTFELSLHPYGQLQIYNEFYYKNKNIIFCSGRGSGKSILGRACIALGAINYNGSFNRATSYYNVIAAPTQKQAVKIHWEPLVYLFTETPLKNFVRPRGINKTDRCIYLKGNRPAIILAGLNDDGGDKIRGSSVPVLLIDEFQDVETDRWEAALEPCVSRANGKFVITGTPKGLGTPFYNMVQNRMTNPNWVYKTIRTVENLTIPNIKKIVREARLRLPERIYKQEYEASWELFPGQIYDCLKDEHIVEVNHSPDYYDACYLGVDFSDYHPGLVVVGQKGFPAKYYVLESWAPVLEESMPFSMHVQKALELARKYNVVSTWPDLQMPMHTEFCMHLSLTGHPGLVNIDLDAPRLGVMESCQLINNLFHQNRLFINKELTQLIERFRSYHRPKDRFGQFVDKPAPGQREEESDCLRYILGRVEPAMDSVMGLTQTLFR